MSVSSIGSSTYTSDLSAQIKGANQSTDAKTTEAAATTKAAEDTGVVYEASGKDAAAIKTTNKSNPEVIAQLKADADARLSQLQGIVEKLISKQGKASEDASIWSQFRQGVLDGSISVDEETAKKAAEDISEDGYWGVKQTSERILDFAKALTGGDATMADKMQKAIEKGFKQASKLWGDELPEISQKTYDAVMKGIEDWKNGVEA